MIVAFEEIITETYTAAYEYEYDYEWKCKHAWLGAFSHSMVHHAAWHMALNYIRAEKGKGRCVSSYWKWWQAGSFSYLVRSLAKSARSRPWYFSNKSSTLLSLEGSATV